MREKFGLGNPINTDFHNDSIRLARATKALLCEISTKLSGLLELGFSFIKICSSIDGRPLLLKINNISAETELIELNGDEVTDGSVGVNCAGEV